MDSEVTSDTARRRELCDFLKYARSRINPSEAGIVATGRRRVPGLRRDEVAALCGVSVAWYTWFETGRPNVHPSPRVIAAVARSLRLSTVETTYLFSLAIAEMPRMTSPIRGVESVVPDDARAGGHMVVGFSPPCTPFDFFPVGVYCTGPDGRIFYANNALISLLGYTTKASYLGLNVGGDLYDDARERSRWQREIEQTGSLRNVVTKARRADGSRIVVRDSATAVRATDGSVLCYLGIWERAQ